MPLAMGGNVPQAKAFSITKVGEGAGVPLKMLALGGNTTHSKALPLSLVAGEVQVGVPHPPSHDRLSYGWECSSSKSFPHHRSGGGGGGGGLRVPLIMLAMGGNTTHSKALPLSLVEGGVWVQVTSNLQCWHIILVGMSLNQMLFSSVK